MSNWFARNRHRYPDNWDDISERAKFNADYRCEACGEFNNRKNILTVHHLDHNPANCSFKNLIALCQRCHLRLQGFYLQAFTREEAVRLLRQYYELAETQLSFWE